MSIGKMYMLKKKKKDLISEVEHLRKKIRLSQQSKRGNNFNLNWKWSMIGLDLILLVFVCVIHIILFKQNMKYIMLL